LEYTILAVALILDFRIKGKCESFAWQQQNIGRDA